MGLYLARLLCPWDCPVKNTGVGWHFLLQGIFQLRDRTSDSSPAVRCPATPPPQLCSHFLPLVPATALAVTLWPLMETRPTCPAGLPHPLTTHSTAPAAKLRPCLLPTRMPSWSVKASWAGPAPLSAPPCSSSSSPALPACPVCAGGSSSAPLPIPPPATSHQLPSESRGHLLQPAAQLAPGKSLLPFTRSLEHALGNRYQTPEKPTSVRQANGSGSTHHKMIGREMSYQRNSEPQSMRKHQAFRTP